jgi:peptide/nickel transport system substrate-binding protein
MGLDERDSEGYRRRPDGETLAIVVEYIPVEGPKGPVCELAKEYWEDVGIKITLKSEYRSALEERLDANEHDIGVWHTDSCTEQFCQIEPLWFYPGSRWCMYIPKWREWFVSDGEIGEEPPDEWKEIVDTFHTWNMTDPATDPKEWTSLAQKIWDFHAEKLYVIGTVGMPIQPVVAKNYIKNVLEDSWWGWDNRFWDPQLSSTWFIEE